MKIITIEQDGPIGFTADHHIGNHGGFGGALRGGLNDRARLSIASLRSAIKLMQDDGCVAHVLLGDLFDTNKPRPALTRAVQRIFKASPLQQIALLGNHEFDSLEPDDNALSPLSEFASVITEPTIVRAPRFEVWCVPFMPSDVPYVDRLEQHLQEFSAVMGDAARECVVLALHVGISDDKTPAWLRTGDCLPLGKLKLLAKGHGINRVISGDWHDYKSWGGRFIQCGALTPTGFDNPGLDFGQVHIFEPAGTMRMHQVAGPRFIQLASVDDFEPPDMGGLIYAQVTTTSERYIAEKQAADELVKSSVLAGARVRVDRKELRADARAAAMGVRSTSTLTQAASTYVAAMPMPTGEVDRARVQAKVLDFLARHTGPTSAGSRPVQVSKIQIEGFAATDSEQTLELPRRGLVVVTGPNGAGKTSLIEAVAHAGWDQSIKDDAKGCFREVRDGSSASIQLRDGTWITRTMLSGRRKKVRIIEPNTTAPDFELPTRMRPQLEALLGDFKVWRSTCVFTSSSKSFTGATDGERKRMLEQVLELSVFDAALTGARSQLKDADERSADLERQRELGDAKAGALADRLADLAKQLEHVRASPPVLTLPAEPEDLGSADAEPEGVEPLDVAQNRLREAEEHARADQQAVADARAEIGAREREINTFRTKIRSLDADTTQCPTCGTTLDKTAAQGHAHDIQLEIEALQAEIETVLRPELATRQTAANEADKVTAAARQGFTAARDGEQRRKAREQQRERYRAARERWQQACAGASLEHEKRVAAHGERLAQLEQQINDLELEQFDLEDAGDTLHAELLELKTERRELRACVDALGLKGIRANLMTGLLSTVEQLANRWLEDLGNLRIELRPYAPRSDGDGDLDVIHLKIIGGGGGRYGDCSQGQQRRIDIAILLALSEAVGGLGAKDASTLFFDEVFDALDPGGQAAVARVIRELARERCCVVITHVPQLAHELRADLLVSVVEGKIAVKRRD